MEFFGWDSEEQGEQNQNPEDEDLDLDAQGIIDIVDKDILCETYNKLSDEDRLEVKVHNTNYKEVNEHDRRAE